MDYEVDLYLRQKWHDERLQHPDITEVLDLNDPNLVKAIWKPEVYFPNAKHAEFQFVTVPNVLIRINPDGEILYMLRSVSICASVLRKGIKELIKNANEMSPSQPEQVLITCLRYHQNGAPLLDSVVPLVL
ncbi:unnamed protein product [Nezara viridula]|uniref:Neurotransmitter-gated ion-channel ligand-binding domain-containing protein n=1 Tax=Nezara viridula TaxID=85310 RepID=A0A9P0HQR7_NEZVI|nr:unnamed protein product [Nezara viridula]